MCVVNCVQSEKKGGGDTKQKTPPNANTWHLFGISFCFCGQCNTSVWHSGRQVLYVCVKKTCGLLVYLVG